MRQRRGVKKGVIYSWLISYISVLTIPLLITGVLFWGVERLVNTKISSMNESILYQIQGTLDNMFDSIYKSSLQIEFSNELGSVLPVQGELDEDYFYQLYKLQDYIRRYTTYNDYVEDVIVYLNHSGYSMTSQSSYNGALFSEMLKHSGLTPEDWEYLDGISKRGFYILQREGDQDNRIVYTAQLTAGRLLVLPKKKYFNQKISGGGKRLEKAVYLSSGDAVMALGEVPSWLNENVSSALVQGNLNRRNKDMLYSSLDSNTEDIRYIIVEQYQSIYRELQLIRVSVFLSISFSIILGIWFAVYFTKKNYMPVKELIASVMKGTDVKKEHDVNEYIFLSNAMANVISNKQEAERQLSLIKLLRGYPVADAAKLFTSDLFVVVAFAIEDTSGFFGSRELMPDSHRLLSFTVSNCNKDFFEEAAALFDVVELDRYLLQIICYEGQQEEGLKQQVWNKLEGLHLFFNDTLKIKMSMALGEFCNRPEDIAKSYETAKEALEYRMVMGNNVVIDSTQLMNFSLFYNYSIENEKDIINSLKNGNFEQSRDFVFEVIDSNLASGMMSTQLARCMLFDIAATVMKALSLTKLDNTFLGQLNLIDRLSRCETFEQMKQELSEILYKACQYINQDRQDPNKTLFRNILDYVDQHYMDPALNVSMLSTELYVSKTFLIKLFKDNTGLTPLDYINRLRCERAIAILGMAEYTVEEISCRVGYSSSHSFIRVFKKLYGKTPGAYRMMLINEGLEKKI